MKIKTCLLVAVIIHAYLIASAKEFSTTEKEELITAYSYWKEIGSGLGSGAIRSPFGRYLLLKNENTLLALKAEKHFRSADGNGQASNYSWILLVEGKKMDNGTFSIDEEKGSAFGTIELGGFCCKWSWGDWVYFDPKLPNMEMAVTEATEKNELTDESTSPLWWSHDKLQAYTEGKFSVNELREAMGLEPAHNPLIVKNKLSVP